MKPIRVAVVCDLREEGWHSMDLMADMLMDTLPAVAHGVCEVSRLCPPMVSRWSRLPIIGRTPRARLGDRLTGRLWDYPRWLVPRVPDFDVFHILDHSYAHLVRVLPADRTVVTCYDLDAVRARPTSRAHRLPARLLSAQILKGLGRAAHVACVSHATKTELLETGQVDADRVSVVYAGVHPSCSPEHGGAEAGTGARSAPEILHVGSTIPRKRIDVLLEMLAGVRKTVPGVRLTRVGGKMTSEQRALARTLGVFDAITEMPFIERNDLAALYRRASLVVLPSDREGFGLPVVEALACGTPVVASAIPALQEVGGDGVTYCTPGDVQGWVKAASDLLREREAEPTAWQARRQRALAASSRFNWTTYATEMTRLYRALAS